MTQRLDRAAVLHGEGSEQRGVLRHSRESIDFLAVGELLRDAAVEEATED